MAHFSTVAGLETTIAELAPGHVLVVKLGATWCKPCKKVEPEFMALAASNEWAASYGSVDLSELDEEPLLEALKDFCGCEKIPHFAFYKDGARVDGMQTSDITTVRSALVRLANPVMVIDDDDLDF